MNCCDRCQHLSPCRIAAVRYRHDWITETLGVRSSAEWLVLGGVLGARSCCWEAKQMHGPVEEQPEVGSERVRDLRQADQDRDLQTDRELQSSPTLILIPVHRHVFTLAELRSPSSASGGASLRSTYHVLRQALEPSPPSVPRSPMNLTRHTIPMIEKRSGRALQM